MEPTNNYTIEELANCLSNMSFVIKGPHDIKISKLSTPSEADENSLVWIAPSKKNKEEIIINSRALTIICDPSVSIDHFPNRCFFVTQNPKLAFLRIGNTFFKKLMDYKIHPSAIIHPEAIIGTNVCIGPHTYIGKCEVQDNVIIHGNCYIYDNTLIRSHVTIHPGCTIGAPGLGHVTNENGVLENFPQIGNVIIEKNVELGVNSIIYRGSLSSTKIGENTKIDGNVTIGHNAVIGNNTLIAAHSVIGGSAQIGMNVFAGINVTIFDYIQVGNGAYLGGGTTITEDIPANMKVIPRPAIIMPLGINEK